MSDASKRLHTLLTDRAIAGLDAREHAELTALLAGEPIDPSYEHAAAAIELALLDHTEPLPAGLEAAIAEQAGRYWGFTGLNPREPTLGGSGGEVMLGGPGKTDEHAVLESSVTNGRVDRFGLDDEPTAGDSGRAGILRATHDDELDEDDDDFELDEDDDDDDEREPPAVARAAPATARERGRKPRRRPDPERASESGSRAGASVVPIPRADRTSWRVARWATYVSALAALVMLAIALWLFSGRDAGPSPDELQASVEAAQDKLEWKFAAKPDEAVSADAGGSVLWSSELQAGVLVIQGLSVNDPTVAQYQLWIVDRDRDGPPVDGGVFDVRASGEVRVPIDAKLLVSDPAAFVVTVERPGGVVVSGQERVALVAAP